MPQALTKAQDPELLLAQGYTMGLGCRNLPPRPYLTSLEEDPLRQECLVPGPGLCVGPCTADRSPLLGRWDYTLRGPGPELQARTDNWRQVLRPYRLSTPSKKRVPETMLLSKAALADIISPQQPQRAGAGGSPTPPPAQEGAALLTGSGSLGARCP